MREERILSDMTECNLHAALMQPAGRGRADSEPTELPSTSLDSSPTGGGSNLEGETTGCPS